MIKMGSFRSYVGLEEYEMKVPHPVGSGPILQPRFSKGELVIAEAHNVLKFTSLAKKKGLSGSLFVTNARLVFVSSDHVCSEDSVPLLSINTLWHYENAKNSGGKKTKRMLKLGPSAPNSPALLSSGSIRIHELLVICSNFRTLRVSFKFSPMDHGLRICNALIHHAFPEQIERLFYFDYCKASEGDWSHGGYINSVPSLDIAGDWLRELKMTRCTGFRITSCNEGFTHFETLPEWFVVPEALNDVRIVSLAEKLKGNRPPFWVWGDSRGAAILRMGKLNDEADSSAENAFFELMRKNHPQMRPPSIHDVETIITVKDVRSSYCRLIEICCPESNSMSEEIDCKFYSTLEQTRWLYWVSKTLQICREIAEVIKISGDVVIIQENRSRDVSCLISSVVQVIIDPRFRTMTGFFSLIQKDWIASGHAFHSEYMHTSPLFLLFLDVTFQLLSQNSMEFEFNDKLLASIWDSTFDLTAGTFIFDSICQRKSMDVRRDFTAWHRLLTKEQEIVDNYERDTRFPFPVSSNVANNSAFPAVPRTLVNPLYKLKPLLFPPSPIHGYSASPYLICSPSMCDIEFWRKLYLSRTAEAIPTIGPSLHSRISSPLLTAESRGKCATPDPVTPDSQSSPFQTTSFISGDAEQAQVLLGRDPMVELKLVDVLLSALSSSTRYQRNSQGSSVPNRSRMVNFSANPTPNQNIHKTRKNPFLM